MGKILNKAILILLLIGLIYSADFTYDATGATQQKKHRDSHTWIYSSGSASSWKQEWVSYDPTSTDNIKKVSHASTVSLTVKAISTDLTCAAFADTTATTESLKIVKFNVASGTTATAVEDLKATNIVTAANLNTKTYTVAGSCLAVKVDSQVYHWDAAATPNPKFVADTALPTMTDPEFSNDFKYIVANDGIYGYTAATKTYAKLSVTATFYKFKKIWELPTAIVVLSWDDITGNTTFKNYRLTAYSITGEVLKEVAKI